jgi:hypothetical protein
VKILEPVIEAIGEPLVQPVGANFVSKIAIIQTMLALAPDSDGVMQTQVTGIGTPTIDITTDHLAIDHESVWRRFAAGSIPYRDGRDVKNEFANPETPVTQVVALEDGQTYLLQAWGTYNITVTGTATGTLTGTAERKVLKLTATADGNATFTINTTPDKFQLENSTGRSDVDTPSEFVTEQTTFCYENEITVASSVVTEPAAYSVEIFLGYNVNVKGALLDPLPSFAYSPGGINLCEHSTQEAAQSVTCSATGKYTLNVFGSGATATIAADTATGTGFGVATPGNPVEIDITATGTITITATGAPEYINFLNAELEIVKDIEPIPTDGAPVTITETVVTPDSANHSDDEGMWFMEVRQGAWADVFGRFLTYSLGDELVTDGGFETGTDWVCLNAPDTCEQSDAKADSGDYSWYLNTSATNHGIYGGTAIYVTKDKYYKLAVSVFAVLGSVTVENRNAFITQPSNLVSTKTDQWERICGVYKANTSGNGHAQFRSTTIADSEFYLDNASWREFESNTSYQITDSHGNTTSVAGNANALNRVAVAYSKSKKLMSITANGSQSTDVAYSEQLLLDVLSIFKDSPYAASINSLTHYSGGTYDQREAKALLLCQPDTLGSFLIDGTDYLVDGVDNKLGDPIE